MERPNLHFQELLTSIKARYTKQPEKVDWSQVKSQLSQALQRYEFPAAVLKRDWTGIEYWDEGYRFDEDKEGLRLVYVGGLDMSEQAFHRCAQRQKVCNSLVTQLYIRATGERP